MIHSEPIIKVGILQRPNISYRLTGDAPWRTVCRKDVELGGGEIFIECEGFELHDVAIGIGFHWERTETQIFQGRLSFKAIPDTNLIVAINQIGIESYLRSVISSEMNANADFEFLKAHAITSRSWLLRQLADAGKHSSADTCTRKKTMVDGHMVDEITRWYDREDHEMFDVCADDHCQRYQGITRQTSPMVAKAVDASRGIVLTYNDEICDARFSKCCGGRTEIFESCWESMSHPYLTAVDDPYCLRATAEVLERSLNSFDREQPGHAQWSVKISGQKLSELILTKSGIDIGELLELRAIERGASGRIMRLYVKGSKRDFVVGKELEIRRLLSTTHLRSSWFDVSSPDKDGDFLFTGKGWGHGVGLCQIGASQMSAEGYSAEEILSFYFPNATLSKLYG